MRPLVNQQQKSKFFFYFLKFCLLFVIFLLVLGCKKPDENTDYGSSKYVTFRDVPGVTEDEISAIEALTKEFDYFIYGMPLSTEAFINENGEVMGYASLFCEWLTELFGIPFQPKIYEWLDLLAGLETGEVSFSGELTATEERQKIYTMTSAIASRPLKYYRLDSSKPLEEISRERPLRHGFIEGTTTIYTVMNELVYGTYEVVLLSDVGLVYDALRSGQIDAFYYSGTIEANFIHHNDMNSFYFYPIIFRPVSLSTQTQKLQPIISVVDKLIKDSSSRYMNTLYNRGEQEYKRLKFFSWLTDEEKEYISNNPIIKFAAEYYNYPVSFYNIHENEWQGIFFDILQEIVNLTGLSFVLANDRNTEWPQLLRMLENGDVSMSAELIRSRYREEHFLWLEKPTLTDDYILVSKTDFPNITKNEISGIRVGLVWGSVYAELFNKWFPDHPNITGFLSFDSAFEALELGRIDMVMTSQNRLLAVTHYNEFVGYKANVVFDYFAESRIGFNRNEAILCSIIDKALFVIDLDSISNQWVSRTFDYRSKLARAQRPWLLGSSFLLMGVLILLTVLFMKNRKEGIKLEDLVQERTIKLNEYQKELETALKTANYANSSKSIFLANMSHEIRTPMNSIIGFSELALDGEISVKTRDYLSNIQHNGKWLLQIINDILDISKIESGKMELENIPFDLHELFASCKTMVMPKAAEKGLKLFFYAEPSVGKKLVGDPTRLRQILVNLLSNAIKFTNVGIIKLYAILKQINENTITISFTITDSGIGMTAEQIEKVFDPFIQAEYGTTRQYGGTGLGLSITKNLVEMMGGSLFVESAPDVGSKFSFELTFNTIDAAKDEIFDDKNVLKEIEKPFFKGEILLCEDNAMNQQVICEHLTRIGLKIVVAENGKIGYEIMKDRIEKLQGKSGTEKPFDLIFMDMYMPVMDGLEASTKILELNTGVPIIAMTANLMFSDMERYKQSGMHDCLGKPFTSQELWRCLFKYLTPVSEEEKNMQSQENFLLEADLEFKKTLQQHFARSNKNKYEEIIKTLRADDIKLAHRLVHNVKSNAGQLGKEGLQKAAADVERHLKDEKNLVTEDMLKVFKTELDAVLTELTPLLDEPAVSTVQAPALEPEKVQALFEELEPLLKSGNPECLNLVAELRIVPGSESLIQQMEDFNFDLAMPTFAELKKKIEKSTTPP